MIWNLGDYEFIATGTSDSLNYTVRKYTGRYGNDDHYDYIKVNKDLDFLELLVNHAIKHGAKQKQEEVIKALGLNEKFKSRN